uniref:Calpain catalytic domain-containing protein n=1 Tax=Pyxicephalus adspersus TaxID=30357 RepID=A0AAV3A8V2_PYXAD|nr:TPA: hypothetical protein GDO54_017439 [Pyxicephalus adspersus]
MEPPPSKSIKSTHPLNDAKVLDTSPIVSQQPLFVDSTFPQDEALHVEGIKWKRPKVCNCWFLSAVACLSLYPQLLEQVMPMEQDFGDGYNGKFRFQFWQYGRWVEVVVDDLLPTVPTLQNGKPHYTLLFVHSKDKAEFWSSLLEKAYAKLKGGYSALQMGFAGEALEDMTGGLVQSSNTSCPASELWKHLDNMLQKGALICCGNTQGEVETSNLMGILSHHMYSVTATKEIQTIQGPVSLLRVRNPWGHTEWIGPWRDGIAVEDFKENFQFLEICHLGPQSLLEIDGVAKPWDYKMYEGRWVKGLSAGGSPTSDYFWMNPQFSLTLPGNDDDNDLCCFIVSVMQKHQRLRRATQRVACQIFKVDDPHAYLLQDQLHSPQPLLSAGPCANHREVVICSSLPPGRYIIIPSLEDCSEGEFLVRVLTEKENLTR